MVSSFFCTIKLKNMKRTFLRSLFIAGIAMIGTVVNAANVNVTAPITTNTTWTSDNTYILFGEITVKNATLTIQPGTVIKADATSLSRLVVTRSGKLVANGTATNPIVFTSNATTPDRGDWGGISILGNAPLNVTDANGNPITKILECGTAPDYEFGGANADDSSGVLTYVRIEYAGYICGTNTELNSLSLGGVGRKTVINHISILYSLDDAIEIWGGNVNIDHFATFSTRDDDFDTDNGWSGKAQFGLIVRDPLIVDEADLSNGFESDNDSEGSYKTPATSGVLSNITVVGPAETVGSTTGIQNGYGARLRRNTAQSIFNSVFIGFNYGLYLEGAGTQGKALGDTLEYKNNVIGGSVLSAWKGTFDSIYLANPTTSNTVFGGNANDDVKLTAPYSYLSSYANFVPQATSPLLGAADFTYSKLSNGFQTVTYQGAFAAGDNWLQGWAGYAEPTGINSAKAYFGEVSVFPNPANSVVNVKVVSKETINNATLDVMDISGRLVRSENVSIATGNNNFSFDVNAIANGLYFVRVAGADFSVSRKVSVSK